MTLISSLIYKILTLFPKGVVKIFSKRYIAGFDFEETLKICKNLNNQGFLLTLDILGEHTPTLNEASSITKSYQNLLESIKIHNLNASISVKPTHIGYDLGVEVFQKNILNLIKTAKQYSNFVRIDMESSKVTDDTISVYKDISKEHLNFGLVFQSYLFRTFNDIKGIDLNNFNFRLCKGIYNESDRVAYQDRNEINQNYLKILDYALSNKIYILLRDGRGDILPLSKIFYLRVLANCFNNFAEPLSVFSQAFSAEISPESNLATFS